MSAVDRANSSRFMPCSCVHFINTEHLKEQCSSILFTVVLVARRGADEQKLRAEEEKRQAMEASKDRNVLGGPLALCGTDPMTGFTREGCCTTGPMDTGSHTVRADVYMHAGGSRACCPSLCGRVRFSGSRQGLMSLAWPYIG